MRGEAIDGLFLEEDAGFAFLNNVECPTLFISNHRCAGSKGFNCGHAEIFFVREEEGFGGLSLFYQLFVGHAASEGNSWSSKALQPLCVGAGANNG